MRFRTLVFAASVFADASARVVHPAQHEASMTSAKEQALAVAHGVRDVDTMLSKRGVNVQVEGLALLAGFIARDRFGNGINDIERQIREATEDATRIAQVALNSFSAPDVLDSSEFIRWFGRATDAQVVRIRNAFQRVRDLFSPQDATTVRMRIARHY
ncbi:hypothetical protein ACRE_073830 [Hapsidospora chrysogenum ATCC 11550]|uniref:Uncharacterized protein n=1 Tax=Hapsidospora chrysogenum (strain ATCC 11550 / CBS 779.69 / DSM 880 / IAM 14645 / JCM 23072 / IMI 49137) TaxID=857340 RepID=A0A086SXP5_HAPC1|nr:hypothetical protein ACRE_073830 [Hapsidospora chrysogenum ATCC 11550]